MTTYKNRLTCLPYFPCIHPKFYIGISHRTKIEVICSALATDSPQWVPCSSSEDPPPSKYMCQKRCIQRKNTATKLGDCLICCAFLVVCLGFFIVYHYSKMANSGLGGRVAIFCWTIWELCKCLPNIDFLASFYVKMLKNTSKYENIFKHIMLTYLEILETVL